MPGAVDMQKNMFEVSPLNHVVALCLAQVCVPPPAIPVWPCFEGGVFRDEGGAGVCNYQCAKRHKVWISAIILNFHHTFLQGVHASLFDRSHVCARACACASLVCAFCRGCCVRTRMAKGRNRVRKEGS